MYNQGFALIGFIYSECFRTKCFTHKVCFSNCTMEMMFLFSFLNESFDDELRIQRYTCKGELGERKKRAIENENDTYLTKFPGIGKKTARQIVLDLKGKVKITEETSETLLQVEGQVEENDNIIKEALLALAALGYSKRELSKVEKVLNKTSIHSVDEAVKIGLKTLVS